MSDFSSMDTANYTDALNTYFSSKSAGEAAYSDAKQAADAKVAKFNEILSTPLQSIGSIAAAKGIGKLLPKVKAGVNNAIKGLRARGQEALDSAQQKASDAVDEQIQGGEAPEGEEGSDITPIEETSDGIELQDATNFGSTDVTNPSSSPDANLDADSGDPDSEEPDEFAPENMPSGSGGRVDLGEETDPADSNTGSASSAGDGTEADSLGDATSDAAVDASADSSAASGTTAAADAGAEAAGEAAAEAGGEAALDATAVAAGAEGGLNPIADLAVLGVGLGMIFGGIFGKKHTSTPPPPPPINPSFQAGTV